VRLLLRPAWSPHALWSGTASESLKLTGRWQRLMWPGEAARRSIAPMKVASAKADMAKHNEICRWLAAMGYWFAVPLLG
jgi:hypothetical protein